MYRIPCNNCEAVYIGETKRSSKHKRALRNGVTDKNRIPDHCWTENHQMDNSQIVDREKNIYAGD